MAGGDVMSSVSSRGGGEMAERDNVATMASQHQQQPQPPPLPLSNRPSSSATNSSSNTPRGANLPKLDSTLDEFPVGMRILVVDDDPICLMVLERMLHRCSYRVTTCGKATDALSLLREDINKFDLVISDVHMPDIDGFKLLELVRLEMDLPVIMTSGNGESSAVMRGITHGACDYLLKPVRIEELRNIWQHVVRKKRQDIKVVRQTKSVEEGGVVRGERQKRGAAPGEAEYTSSANDTTDNNWEGKKRKGEFEEENEEDLDQENDDPSTMKKPRVVWSVELHQQFVSAVNQLGIDKAVPKRILELMGVHGLTRENVASHLQKYRLYLKRLSGVTNNQTGMNAHFGGQDPFSMMSPDIGVNIASGQLTPQALARFHMLGRMQSPNGMGFSGGLDPVLNNMFLQDLPQPPHLNGMLKPNTGLLSSLPNGLHNLDQLTEPHHIPGMNVNDLDDYPSNTMSPDVGVNIASGQLTPQASARFYMLGRMQSPNGMGFSCARKPNWSMASGLMKVVAFIMRLIEAIWRFFGTLASGSNKLENGIQINVELCKRLEWKIGKSRRLIKRRGVELGHRQARIVHKLKGAMERGEDLLYQCKCEGTKSWLYSALTLLNITEDVLDIELELGCWSALLKVVTFEGVVPSQIEVQHLTARYEKLSRGSESLYEAAAEDAEYLESKLKDEMHMHAKGTEQYLLAVYLLTRLKHARGDCDIPVEDVDLLDKHFQKAVKTNKKCLGGGANGAVYAATWLNSHKWAVKVLFAANERRPEATFLQSCNHPNIIRYIWSWQQDSQMGKRVPHILMEGMGMDLGTLIAQKRECNPNEPPFELAVAVDVMLQIAKAVRYLHGNKVYIDGKRSKITHRDLKPKNILVDEDNEGKWKVKLADFGISKVYQGAETLTPSTYREGTYVYAAPEVWLYEARDGDKFKFPPKADVWSFAMTCSEIMTGDPPFLGICKSDLHVKIKEEGIRPRLPDNLDEGFYNFLGDCWHLDPKRRPDFENICRALTHVKEISLDILRISEK